MSRVYKTYDPEKINFLSLFYSREANLSSEKNVLSSEACKITDLIECFRIVF